MSVDSIPKDLRGLRACLVCSIIKVGLVETKIEVEVIIIIVLVLRPV